MTNLLAREGTLRRVIEAASAAPSFQDSRPWQLLVDDDLLEMRADEDRALWAAGRRSRVLYLSCGAALFNLRTVIRMSGFNPLVCPFPQPGVRPLVLAAVRAEPGRPPSLPERELYHAIWRRQIDQGPYSTDPIPGPVQSALNQAAAFEFAMLRSLDASQATAVLSLAREAGAEGAADSARQAEPRGWMTAGSAEDGIRAAALPPDPRREPSPVRPGGPGLARPAVPRQAGDFEPSPHLAVLTTAGDEPADWLRAGQALQRVLLTATVYGLSASFLYQPIELGNTLAQQAPPWPGRENPQMIIRLGYGHMAVSAPRRPLEEVLTWPGGASG